MSIRDGLRNLSYWSQYALLTVFGPAQRTPETDPIELLKRKYGRPPSQ